MKNVFSFLMLGIIMLFSTSVQGKPTEHDQISQNENEVDINLTQDVNFSENVVSINLTENATASYVFQENKNQANYNAIVDLQTAKILNFHYLFTLFETSKMLEVQTSPLIARHNNKYFINSKENDYFSIRQGYRNKPCNYNKALI